MKLLLSYLKSHRKSLFLFGIFILTYGMLIRLFEVPFIVAGYSTAVCVFFGVVIAVYDFSHYREKHRMLVHMEKEITDSAEHLPRLQLTVGTRKYDCQVWDVDFNPTPYIFEVSKTPPIDSSADS